MKKILAITAAMMMAGNAGAALWTYDFGTGTGSYVTAAASTTFLPTPSTDGGTARVRVGTGAGGFFLENPGNASLGSGTELRITAATATSVNKFSIYDFSDAANVFSLGFTAELLNGANGNFQFFAGDGASFSDNSSFSGAHVFSGLEWAYGASDTLTTRYRSGANWVSLSGASFEQSKIYEIAIFGNNSAASAGYVLNGTNYTVAVNTWDLWVNGTRVAGLAKAQLAAEGVVDSFMFIGQSSTGNAATLRVDDIWYANAIPEPGTFGLLGGFGLLLAVRRRMRR
ncbi:MAG: hypothetical protein U1E27_14330 [Kiritimatiellia bacterium]|nr:hypothetical protein [Kiritimatiellia bacterium]